MGFITKLWSLLDGWKLYLLGFAWLFAALSELIGYDVTDSINAANAFNNVWESLLLIAGRSTAEKAIEAFKRRA